MKKVGIKKAFYAIAVVGLLIFFHFTKVLSPVERVFVFIFDPLVTKLFSISSDVNEFYDHSRESKDLSNEIKILEKQLINLTAENARLRIIADENKSLREYLKFFDANDYNYLLASVISRGGSLDINKEGKSVIINKGSADNLVAGMAVVDGNGAMVGKIIEVKDKISELVLTTDPRCKLAVMADNSHHPSGLAQGDLGLIIKMDYIPQDNFIYKNDIIITSGLEEKIPKGLIVGRVTQTLKENNDVWQSAIIEPLADLERVAIVAVIIP